MAFSQLLNCKERAVDLAQPWQEARQLRTFHISLFGYLAASDRDEMEQPSKVHVRRDAELGQKETSKLDADYQGAAWLEENPQMIRVMIPSLSCQGPDDKMMRTQWVVIKR